MARLDLAAALVHHYSGRESEPLLGNERIAAEIQAGSRQAHEKSLRLYQAWTALPDTGGDTPPASEFVSQLLTAGARAVDLFPKQMSWCLDEWCAGSLLKVLEERRVITFSPYDQVDLRELHGVLENHPRLPLILTGVSYRDNRKLFPLYERHPNLHVDLSAPFSPHEGLEQICASFGANHLFFGTGYPKSDPGAAITYLMYSRISEEQKGMIAFGNIERLLEEVIV